MAHAKKTKIKKVGDRKQNGKKDVVIEDELDEITVELTDQQMLFCQQYVANNLNGTKAAIKAGYTAANAGVHASRLLSNDNIKKYVDVLKKDLGRRIDISADMIALEFAKIGFSDMRNFYDENNSLLNISELNDKAAAAVSYVEELEMTGGDSTDNKITRKIKLHDKVRALEALAKMIGADGITRIAQTDTDGNDIKQISIILPPGINVEFPDNIEE